MGKRPRSKFDLFDILGALIARIGEKISHSRIAFLNKVLPDSSVYELSLLISSLLGQPTAEDSTQFTFFMESHPTVQASIRHGPLWSGSKRPIFRIGIVDDRIKEAPEISVCRIVGSKIRTLC
jgi:hypothetical protein